MIVLLNVALMLLTMLLGWIAYKYQKLWPVFLAVGIIWIYAFIQPSYMPKGFAKPAPTPVEFRVIEGPMTDRLMKPKSAEEYDLERQKALDKINNSINEQIYKQQIAKEKQNG